MNPEKIRALYEKFEKLKDLFSAIPSYIGAEYIDMTVAPRKLIKGYPIDQIPQLSFLKEGFYLLPHEGYGRDVIKKAIQDAEERVYLIFETVFDDDLVQFIMKKLISNPRIDFRIVTSPLTAYVQNPAKTRATFVQLASYGAKIRALRNLRGKMLVTDKALVSGSFDLVKMGIGTIRSIRKGLRALVASTEIMGISTDADYIKEAKEEFNEVFDKSVEEYGLWFSKDAENVLRSTGAKKISKEAKEFLGYMIFNEGRKSSERVKRISLIAVEIAKIRDRSTPYIRVEDIQKAEQILLKERKELNDINIRGIIGVLDAQAFLRRLESIG